MNNLNCFLVVLFLLTRGPKESLKVETVFFANLKKNVIQLRNFLPSHGESEKNFRGFSEVHVWID